MPYTVADIVRLIDKMAQDECDLREWDDLVSVWHNDPEIDAIVGQIISIEKEYGDRNHGVLITDVGVLALKELADRLRNQS